MPLTVQGSHFTSFDGLPTGLRRRSSCPSIPRSVSVCSSNYAIDFSGEFSRVPTECRDVEIYMSPLFRGLGGIGEEHAELMSARATRGFTSRVEAIDYDDSLSDSLSNYQFDIVGLDLDHIPEPTKAPEAKLSTEQSSTPTHPRSLVAPGKPLKPKASQLFPPRDPSPSPKHFHPSVPPRPPKPTRPIPDIPMNAGSTRPLKIDRSRKRTGPSVTSQWTPRNVAPASKPISRATTQGNLREAYRRDRPLADQKVPTRSVRPAMPPYPYPHAKTPDKKVTQVNAQPSLDIFASYLFIPLHSKSLSQHCFQQVSFHLIARKINSSMPIVWTDCHLNPILLTLQRFLRRTTVSGRVAGLSAVHLKSRRAETT